MSLLAMSFGNWFYVSRTGAWVGERGLVCTSKYLAMNRPIKSIKDIYTPSNNIVTEYTNTSSESNIHY